MSPTTSGGIASLTRRSPLSHRQPLKCVVSTGELAALCERPFEGKLIVRANWEKASPAVAAVLGQPLPEQSTQTRVVARGTMQWLGPDEWLIVTPTGVELSILAELSAALTGVHHQMVDVTDGYTTIVLSGRFARDMLMKTATIDFHPRSFQTGMGVTTNFGRTIAWLRQSQDGVFDLVVRDSMADYLWCLLASAGREWGLPSQEPKGSKVKLHLPHLDPVIAGFAAETVPDMDVM